MTIKEPYRYLERPDKMTTEHPTGCIHKSVMIV